MRLPILNHPRSHSATQKRKRVAKYNMPPAPAPIGQGFDRWWLLLAKGHVPHGLLWAIALLEIAGLALSALWLRESFLRAAMIER